MSTVISGGNREEPTKKLSCLEKGDAFRLLGTSFESVIVGDDAGNAYRVLSEKEKGLVEVISLDHKLRRRLPEETEVIPHDLVISLISNP